jgi:hypothetical protein
VGGSFTGTGTGSTTSSSSTTTNDTGGTTIQSDSVGRGGLGVGGS